MLKAIQVVEGWDGCWVMPILVIASGAQRSEPICHGVEPGGQTMPNITREAPVHRSSRDNPSKSRFCASQDANYMDRKMVGFAEDSLIPDLLGFMEVKAGPAAEGGLRAC